MTHALFLSLALLVSPHVLAAITPAGTVINNTATLTYSTGDVTNTATSNTASLTVDELINVLLTWQDASSVIVNSPDIGDALTFLLSNTGNGQETFTLARNNTPAASDDYDPITSTISLFIESNGNPGLQVGPGGDAPYSGGITLDIEESRIVYVLSDTPGSLATGSRGLLALSAASTTEGAAGAAPGTVLPGAGTGGIAAIVGASRAQSTALGSYITSGLSVRLDKAASVVGADKAAAGSTLAYTISVTISGTGTASNLLISDPLPAEVNYTSGSLEVDSVSKTDAADTDNAQFSSNTVTVDLGDVTVDSSATPASVTHVITFSATVK